MSKHTPEPWEVKRGDAFNEIVSPTEVVPIVNWQGFDDANRTTEQHNANADRIVLCVNAMSGIASAEPGSVAKLVEAARNFKAAADALHLAQIMRCRKTLDFASERYKENFIAMNTALAAITLEGGG